MKTLTDKTCQDTEYYTPERILTPVRRYFGYIDLDPATSPHNPVKARHFFTPEDNGLIHPWDQHGNVFVNPPYGRELRAWCSKIKVEAQLGSCIIALLPGQRFEQEYWQTEVFNSNLDAFCFVRKRLAFLDANGKPRKGNPYGSVLYLYNGNQAWFQRCFGSVGLCVPYYPLGGGPAE